VGNRRDEFHPHGVGQPIKLDHVLSIAVGYGDAEADILDGHGIQAGKGPDGMVETIIDAAHFIVGRRQPLDGDAHADLITKAARRLDDAIREIAVRAYDDSLRLGNGFLDDLIDIRTQKRLTSRDVDEGQIRGELFDQVRAELLALQCGVLPCIAHIAFGIAAVGDD
jgi:hypothetical protein